MNGCCIVRQLWDYIHKEHDRHNGRVAMITLNSIHAGDNVRVRWHGTVYHGRIYVAESCAAVVGGPEYDARIIY